MSRQQRMQTLLHTALEPNVLLVEDESSHHNVPQGAESHFKITAVSSRFDTLTRIERHRLIHSLLEKEFSLGLHALTLHLYTPDDWAKQQEKTVTSPACRGGGRHA